MNIRLLLLILVISTLFIVGFTSVRERLVPGKHIYTEIEIDAPIEAVWAVLADIERYPSWNPYHVQVEGEFTVDAPLVVHIEKPNGESISIHPHLMRIIPNQELTWGGGVRGIFYGEHVFLLEALTNGGTKLIHKEDFTGVAVRFVPLDAIDEGYQLMNQALKHVIEKE